MVWVIAQPMRRDAKNLHGFYLEKGLVWRYFP